MTGGAIDYNRIQKSLTKVGYTTGGTVVLQTRLPNDVIEALDFCAEQSETNRSAIVRQALLDYFNKMAEQQNEEPKQ